MARPPREIDQKRWRRSLVDHLDDYPRQLAALRFSARSFGTDFELAEFAAAFASDEPKLYTRVQALERAVSRLQSYMAAMSSDGAKLAGLPLRTPGDREPRAQPAFEALRDDGALTKHLCAKIVASQKLRNRFEHDYVRTQADDVHEAAKQMLRVAPEFLDRFVHWVEPYLSSS